jgi:hypothetical protein
VLALTAVYESAKDKKLEARHVVAMAASLAVALATGAGGAKAKEARSLAEATHRIATERIEAVYPLGHVLLIAASSGRVDVPDSLRTQGFSWSRVEVIGDASKATGLRFTDLKIAGLKFDKPLDVVSERRVWNIAVDYSSKGSPVGIWAERIEGTPDGLLVLLGVNHGDAPAGAFGEDR